MHCSHVAVITNKNEYAAQQRLNDNANNLTAQLLAVVEVL